MAPAQTRARRKRSSTYRTHRHACLLARAPVNSRRQTPTAEELTGLLLTAAGCGGGSDVGLGEGCLYGQTRGVRTCLGLGEVHAPRTTSGRRFRACWAAAQRRSLYRESELVTQTRSDDDFRLACRNGRGAL